MGFRVQGLVPRGGGGGGGGGGREVTSKGTTHNSTKVWSVYRYSMMVSQERKCGLCTGAVQYDGQSGAKVWSMYRYSMMVSLHIHFERL